MNPLDLEVEVSELEAFQDMLKDMPPILDEKSERTKARANIDHAGTLIMMGWLYDSALVDFFKDLRSKGWKFLAVRQTRGRCYYKIKTITIPAWAYNRSGTYRAWYIAHEMAHAYAGWEAKHGEVFMSWLQAICPADALHHELGYKPRNAANAGITRKS